MRSNDPCIDEIHVVIDKVADRGSFLLISSAWQGHDLEVLIRRVGDPHLQQQES